MRQIPGEDINNEALIPGRKPAKVSQYDRQIQNDVRLIFLDISKNVCETPMNILTTTDKDTFSLTIFRYLNSMP